MSDKLREALKSFLYEFGDKANSATVQKARAALAADDAARGTMRDEFEAWWLRECQAIKNKPTLEKLPNGDYRDDRTQRRWRTWQASRAAAPQSVEPVAELLQVMIGSATAVVEDGGTIVGYRIKTGALHKLIGLLALAVPASLPEQPADLEREIARLGEALGHAKADAESLEYKASPPTAPTDAEWLEEAMRLYDQGCDLHATTHGYGSGKVREALRAHLSTRPQRDKWQPIETAPRDGTRVLCVCVGVRVGRDGLRRLVPGRRHSTRRWRRLALAFVGACVWQADPLDAASRSTYQEGAAVSHCPSENNPPACYHGYCQRTGKCVACEACAPASPQPAAQPEPSGLTDERIEELRAACLGRCSGELYPQLFARAIEREVLAAIHKRSDAEVAEVMVEADIYADAFHRHERKSTRANKERRDFCRARLERLARGEKS